MQPSETAYLDESNIIKTANSAKEICQVGEQEFCFFLTQFRLLFAGKQNYTINAVKTQGSTAWKKWTIRLFRNCGSFISRYLHGCI